MQHPYWIDKRHFDFSRPTESWWEASAGEPRPSCPPLDGNMEADVAIIGAGYTGLNAALRLASRHQARAVVLEAGDLGWGASGRNGGFCSPGGAHMEYSDMARRWGLDYTREFTRAQYAAIDYVGSLGQRHGLDYQRQGTGEFILGSGTHGAGQVVEQAQWLLQKLGVEARAVGRGQLAEQGLAGPLFSHALHLPGGFGLHPLRYTLGLARAAQRAGARICSGSPVLDWHRDGSGHRLETPGGTLHAGRVLIATNGYTQAALGRPLGQRIMPVFSNILVTRPLAQQELAAQGWSSMEIACDDRALLHYFRLLPGNRFLFGGRGGISGRPAEEAATRQRLEREFRILFPAWGDVPIEYFWSGLVCLARDLSAHVGAVPGTQRAWFSLAYHGGGVSMGSWCGAALADLCMGARDRDFALPALLTRPMPVMPFPALRPAYLRGAYAWFTARERWSGTALPAATPGP